MREQIHTIPVNEAFETADECPFCHLEREAEQRAIRYTAGPGASYMEPEVRAATDAAGFCGAHMKKLYDYGNTLGSALMLQTYMAGMMEELSARRAAFSPPRRGLLSRKKQTADTPCWQALRGREDRCFLCEKIDYNMQRYYATFFMLVKDPQFREKVQQSKGFCMRHFSRLLEEAEKSLPHGQSDWFYETVFSLMEENLQRVKGDLDWLIAKFDYRNAGKPWGNSQDALQRTMQKLRGIYPADPPYKKD